MRVPGIQPIMTVDPENIKTLLATQFNDFGKGKEFHDSWQLVFGLSTSLTVVSGWRYIYCRWRNLVGCPSRSPPPVSQTTYLWSWILRTPCPKNDFPNSWRRKDTQSFGMVVQVHTWRKYTLPFRTKREFTRQCQGCNPYLLLMGRLYFRMPSKWFNKFSF